ARRTASLGKRAGEQDRIRLRAFGHDLATLLDDQGAERCAVTLDSSAGLDDDGGAVAHVDLAFEVPDLVVGQGARLARGRRRHVGMLEPGAAQVAAASAASTAAARGAAASRAALGTAPAASARSAAAGRATIGTAATLGTAPAA